MGIRRVIEPRWGGLVYCWCLLPWTDGGSELIDPGRAGAALFTLPESLGNRVCLAEKLQL